MTFRIDIPQADLQDLQDRLARVRFPNVVDQTETELTRRLVERWRDGFDWRAVETRLNQLDQRISTVDGVDLHHIVYPAAGQGPAVLLLHGWPDSFLRYQRLAPLLAAAGHEVVVPSLPGFGFSAQPEGEISDDLVAGLLHQLMTGLGHQRYAVHGGDWGSAIAEALATTHPAAVAALHLVDVPYTHQFGVDREDASEAETAFLDAAEAWAAQATYVAVQSAEPTLLSYALADSPVGLAAWMADKYRTWTDREPDLDDVLAQVSLYWHTNTIRSSMRLYSEGMGSWDDSDGEPAASEPWSGAGPLQVPTAFALFPADIGVPPREFAERFFDVQRFTLMPRGGHFGAMEEPQALADDMIAFLSTVS